MALDPTRAARSTREFEYETVQDFDVRAAHPQAREIMLNTQLDEAAAATLAQNIFDETSSMARVFEVVIQGAVPVEAFDLSPPTYTLDAATFATDGRTLKVIDAEIDYRADTTTLTVRG